MKAVTTSRGSLAYEDVPRPAPGSGQLVLDVERCGICGSDLHALKHSDELADVLELCGYDRYMRSDQTAVMGHEIYGRIAELGPSAAGKLKVGTPVVTIPLVRTGRTVDGIGLSASAPGGYAQQVVVQESFTIAVPNGLAPDVAALTEPMAVGWHAVIRSEITKKDVAIVIGCGPVGLAVIASLATRGIATIIASDYSPGRRALATRAGAHLVVDPAVDSPWDHTGGHGHMGGMPDSYNAGLDLMDGLNKLPVPWWAAWRGLDRVGATAAKRPIVFECVGVPGMIDGILASVPLNTRVVVVGVCMGPDSIRPSLAINKEVDLRFVVGYTPVEFRDTLRALANGKLDPGPIVTGRVGLAGVAGAFDSLRNPETHAKILIDPSIVGADIVRP